MQRFNVGVLPVAANVCDQVLREVHKTEYWSMAHVIMNPKAKSIFHAHHCTNETYVITKGFGLLSLSTNSGIVDEYLVYPGSVIQIMAGVGHKLENLGFCHLEHLVIASPPFRASDVQIIDEEKLSDPKREELQIPEIEEGSAGSKILSYQIGHQGLSIAYGWVTPNQLSPKMAHFHRNSTEYIFVVSGRGKVHNNINDIEANDFLIVSPGQPHALTCRSPEDMITVCICSPGFDNSDMHFKS